MKDTFRCTNLYSVNTFLPLKEDNLSIMDKMIRPKEVPLMVPECFKLILFCFQYDRALWKRFKLENVDYIRALLTPDSEPEKAVSHVTS